MKSNEPKRCRFSHFRFFFYLFHARKHETTKKTTFREKNSCFSSEIESEKKSKKNIWWEFTARNSIEMEKFYNKKKHSWNKEKLLSFKLEEINRKLEENYIIKREEIKQKK